MKMNFTKLLVVALFSSFFTIKAQQNNTHNGHSHDDRDAFYLPLEFDKDSLKGFDEEAAWQNAKMNAGEFWKQQRLVAVLKRNFIDFKYGYSKPSPPPTVQGPCSNPDFENGTLSGWTPRQGPNNNSLTMAGCCGNTTSNIVIVTPGADPNIAALPRVPPGGGNFACRLGPTGAGSGGTSYRMSQSFTVTPANSVFIYKYAVVLNKAPHDCDEQPFFNVSFKDCNGNPIPCGQYNVSAIGSACSTGGDPSFNTSNATWAYKDWTTAAFDLTAYIGQCVNLEFTVAGCVASQGAHGAYAYIDASCQPFTLNLNGTDIPVGQTNSSFCGASTTNTLCAPPGFSYNWDGPGVTGQTGQCINTSSTGTYSVTLGIPGTTCAFNPVLYSTFNSAPNPTVTASLTQPVCVLPAGTATVDVTGGTGPYTYSWTPAAPSTSVNTNLPPTSSYTVDVIDSNGCLGSTSFSIDPYPPAPSYTLSTVPGLVLSCNTPSTTITFTATNANTSTSWEGPLGVITASNTVVTVPGIYTYTAINTVSTCSLTGTVEITGSLNLPVLTSTVTQPACAIPLGSATVSATNGEAPYTYSWTPAVASSTSATNSNLPPGTSYTVSVIDNLGCKGVTTFDVDAFSGAPQYTLSNNPGLLLTCASPSTTLTFAPTNTNTSTSWEGPSGTIAGTSTVVTSAGVYTYTALNTVSTCSLTGTVVVTSDILLPTATFTSVCNTNTINLDAVSPNPNITLEWGVPSTPTVVVGNPVSSAAMGVYTLTATDPSNGCVSTYTTLISTPPINVVTSPSTNLITCVTKTIQATTSPSSPSVTIYWTDGVTTSTTNTLPITTGGTYTTVVQASGEGSCLSYSVITVNTNTVANVNIIPSATLIPCSTGSVSLSANSFGGGTYTYVWTPSSPTFTGSPLIATEGATYTVTALNTVNGCTATATQFIDEETVNASFVANPYAGDLPLPVSFTNTSTNPSGTNYTWDFGDGTGLASNSTTVSTVYNTQGNFPVVLTAINGTCQDTAIRFIKVDLISIFTVPNVFTPNGDGKNDVFTFNAINMGEITLTIFDRWGLKMFESTATGNVKWDGKNKGGATVPDGTYFYIIKAVGLDDKQYDLKGTVNIFQ